MANIKLIDDDKDQVECLSTVLKSAGHQVTTYDRMAGALESVESDMPDLIVLDVMFPESPSGGLELAISIRRNEKTKHIPIILLSNVNRCFPTDLSQKDIDPQWMPVQDFLEKPVDFEALLAKVSELLKKP